MTPEQALELIKAGEGQRIEFKQSFAEGNQAIEELCGFANANHDGGTVFFGVTDDGQIYRASLGKKTLEDFVHKLKANTDPVLTPSIDELLLEGETVVAVTVRGHMRGEVFYAFNIAWIRVGKSNIHMSPDEQRARLLEGQADPSALVIPYVAPRPSNEERECPVFAVSLHSVRRLEQDFEPSLTIRRVSGDNVPDIEWRFRGPRFSFAGWRQAEGARLQQTNISGVFDLSVPPTQDDLVQENEMGLEIRFYWRGKWRRELHRWRITRKVLPQKVLWDVADKILPPTRYDEKE